MPPVECLFLPTDSFLIYGDTGAGKTPQIGEAAEHVALATGKKTLLYNMDRGGQETIRPHLNLKMIEVEDLRGYDPWVAINAAVTGKRYDKTRKQFLAADLSPFGLLGFESLSAMADELRLVMTKTNAQGTGVGGKASYVFKAADGSTVSSNTMTDYAVVQSFMTEKAWQSQVLGLPIIWTSHVQRGQDDESNSPVLGPVIAGKALTTVAPRWFTYTFRIDAIPVLGMRARHILYIEEHTDTGLKGFANDRIPLGTITGFKPVIEPASIVEAMKQIRSAQKQVTAQIEQRLCAAGVNFQ